MSGPELGGRGARTITLALGGKRYGRYGAARCPAHDELSPSLSLADGSNERLLLFCHAGCSFAEIVVFLERLGILGEHFDARPLPRLGHATHEQRQDHAHVERRGRRAKAVWDETTLIGGTPAEKDLRSRARCHRLCGLTLRRGTRTVSVRSDRYERVRHGKSSSILLIL